MAFNLELVKTKVTDFVHTLEADLGPELAKVKSAFATVLGQVHAQVSADEATIKDQVIGDVKTVDDAVTASAAAPTPAPEPASEPGSEPGSAAPAEPAPSTASTPETK